MKTKIRAIGIDDAPFKFSDDEVLVVGSIVRAPNYLEGVISTKVDVDGYDATEKVVKMINDSRFAEQGKVIFIDGAALGGFNLVDLSEVYDETDIPIISVSRDEPDFDSIKKALKSHFDDWEEKYESISKGEIIGIETEHKPIYVQCEGVEIDDLKHFLRLFTVRGRLPEPIRISHIVASGIVSGESRGKP
ncbi:MAG: DUF99 family protein [Thermoplasmatota archaeon]